MSNTSSSSGTKENKLSNNNQNATSITLPGNPDIKFPPQSGNAIPFSENGKITGWAPISGNGIVISINGQLSVIPLADGIVISSNGVLSVIPKSSSNQLLNGSFSWTPTVEC